MAYGLKYELLCTSKINSDAYKLKLLFDGFVGDDIDRNMPAESALVLRKDKEAVIRGTSLDFAIREAVDFEMDEFYTNNPKKIKAELYKNTILIWTGYNLPQQYSAPYIPVPVSIRFTATDGLGLLKNEKFNLTGINSQLATIVYCIDKIGLALGYSIAINLFETAHSHDRSPLEQTYEDASIYDDKDCYSVIENILSKYDAEITQVNNRWYITRSADKKSTRMLYTSAGVYDTTAAASAVLDLGYPDTAGVEVWPVGQLSRGLEPGGKQVTIKYDFGRKNSLLTNYEFWRYSGGQFSNWTQNGSFTLSQRIKEGRAYAFLVGYTNDNSHQIYQAIAINNATGEDFVFELNYAPIGRASAGGISTIMMTVRMAVSLTDGATTYYLSKTDGWTTSPTIIEETVKASLISPIWNPIRIITDELPISGTMTVALYQYYLSTAPRPGDTYSGMAFSDPLLYFLRDGELYPSGLETVATFDDSTEPGDIGIVSILAADAPDYENNGLLYENITRLSDGTPTELWHVLGSSSFYSQVVQLARTMASNNRVARQKLTGTIKGTGISFDSIIKHTYNSSREFEIAECQWDLYNENYQVTLLELLTWSSEDITFTTESENSSSSTGQIPGAIITGVIVGNDAGITEYSAEDILAKLITIDGTGSGLDADLLEGQHGAYYAPIASPTFTGVVTMPASVVIPDGGTIGQAAGPLLTFDDTLNYLEISGCNVGIGTTTPVSVTEISNLLPYLTLSKVSNQVDLDDALGVLNFYSHDASVTSFGGVGNIAVRAETAYNTANTPSYMTFSTHEGTTNDGTVLGNVTEWMRLTSGGNLGLGTISPGTKLDVVGAVRVKGGNSFIALRTGNDYGWSIYSNASNFLTIGTGLTATPAATTWVTIRDDNGYVGIGTADPNTKLDVNGQIFSRVTGTTNFVINSADQYGTIQNDASNKWSLGYNSSSTTLGTPVLTWNTTGNVGIGTIAPITVFDVFGTSSAPTLANYTSDIATFRTSTGPVLSIGAQLASPYGLWLQAKRASDTTSWPLLLNPVGGNVGIGTTAPDAKLHSLAITEQLRLGYDVSNYAAFTVGSTGDLTIAATGGDVVIPHTDTICSADWNRGTAVGWGVYHMADSRSGGADFRYLTADELHVKRFIADLEQALAGSQIICKSVAVLYADCTLPAKGAQITIAVEDLPGSTANVFVNDDWIQIRSYDRTDGGLEIVNAFGRVEFDSHHDAAGDEPGYQHWSFARAADDEGSAVGGVSVVKKGSIVLDFGVSGDGFVETTAVDSTGSPYQQIVTWTTAPYVANRVVRTRTGQLDGITGIGDEWGLFAGSVTNKQYLLATDAHFELHGIDISLYDGATNTVKLDHTGLSFAMGAALPTGFLVGDGIWMGKDTAYKMRVGTVSGGALVKGFKWDGTDFAIIGSVTATTGAIGGFTIDSTNLYAGSGATRVQMGSAAGFWAGATAIGDAPFSVTNAGVLKAISGTIGGFTLSSTTLIAGTTTTRISLDTATGIHLGATAFADAPFSVTRAGALKATGIAELGTATENYGSGLDYALAIKGSDIWENAYNGDGSSIYINRKSHGGTTDHFRNFYVQDGKGTTLFSAVGSTGAVNVNNALTVQTTLTVDGITRLNARTSVIDVVGGTPSSYAVLDLQSTTKGFIPPRMTTTQMNALTANAVEGMVIYNGTIPALCVFTGGAWWQVLLG